MSNDINYDLRFRSDKRSTLTQVKDYLTEKKRQWDGRGSKTAKDLLKEAGLKHPAEVVAWGFEFGSIRKQADGTYSADVSSWANENSLGNVWISGDKGELKFLLDRFPGLNDYCSESGVQWDKVKNEIQSLVVVQGDGTP